MAVASQAELVGATARLAVVASGRVRADPHHHARIHTSPSRCAASRPSPDLHHTVPPRRKAAADVADLETRASCPGSQRTGWATPGSLPDRGGVSRSFDEHY